MLAMLAAYQQLTAAPQAKPDTPVDTASTTSTDSAQLAALQPDAGGKRPALELDTKTEPTAAKPAADSTSALQQAQADKASADQLAKLGDGDVPHAQLTTEQKAEAFATKLAEVTTQPQAVLPQAAQALAATAQAAQAAAASQLQARVGTNAWEQQLGQKVVWMVAGGDQSASLTLNPPDLGPLQVVLNVSNDSATATFTAAQPETRQAIENALPKLREMMSEAGIALGNATVSAGTQDQQGAFAEQARAAGGGGRRSGNGIDGAPAEAPQPVVRQTVLGAVDTFA
jgi:flagellar hook-length control protein FliK